MVSEFKKVSAMSAQFIKKFFQMEASGGILLVLAALSAIIIANSGLAQLYNDFLNTPFTVKIGSVVKFEKDVLLFINDGLMAIFFFLVGLEIKREIIAGQLASKKQFMLPAFAALGGMLVPALIFYIINVDYPQNIRGWAIPAATDIAFALGVITLLGKRVPDSLKVALVAIAIIDDLGAILIIAFFYTEQLVTTKLIYAFIPLAGLLILNSTRSVLTSLYVVFGIILWYLVLKSGVHATIAGVVTALCIPYKCKNDSYYLNRLEHGLHPYSAFIILPVFAFANAGISLDGVSWDVFTHPITLGIILGLFFGKQIGIMGMTWAGVKTGFLRLPAGINYIQYYGMAILTGIGFTMSLFIGNLAFSDPAIAVEIRVGVLTGSILSAVSGFLLLKYALPQKANK